MVGTPGETIDPSDFTNTIIETLELDPPESANGLHLTLNHGWKLYADNIDISGAAGTRLWLDCANGADIVIGPRAGANLLGHFRVRTPQTTASAANMFINSTSYEIFRSTSSARYKTDIEPYDIDLGAMRRLRVIRFHDRGELAAHAAWLARQSDPDHPMDPDNPEPEPLVRWYVGLLAEDVDDLGLAEFVQYDEGTGLPDGLMYDRIVLGALQLIQEQAARIDDLAARLAALETR